MMIGVVVVVVDMMIGVVVVVVVVVDMTIGVVVAADTAEGMTAEVVVVETTDQKIWLVGSLFVLFHYNVAFAQIFVLLALNSLWSCVYHKPSQRLKSLCMLTWYEHMADLTGPPPYTCFLGNLSYNTDEEDIRRY